MWMFPQPSNKDDDGQAGVVQYALFLVLGAIVVIVIKTAVINHLAEAVITLVLVAISITVSVFIRWRHRH